MKLTMRLEIGDVKSSQSETLAERISNGILLLAKDLCNDENVIEEENLALMKSRSFATPSISHFIETTIADETPVRQHQIGFLADDALLHFKHLRHVISTRLELGRFDPVVNANEQILIDVAAVVDTPQVLDKILQFHALVSC